MSSRVGFGLPFYIFFFASRASSIIEKEVKVLTYWLKLFGLYLGSGVVYALATGAITYIHYARRYGLEKLTDAILYYLPEQFETSWVYGIINLALWPWRITANALEICKALDEVLETE